MIKFMAKERTHYYDNLKGILILLVVFGHVISPVKDNGKEEFNYIYKIIYLFHMPLFILISGVFSKDKYSIIELFSKLFFPLLFFQIIYSLEEYIINDIPFNLKYFLIEPFSILWYLASLLSWRMLFMFFQPRKSFIILLILVLISCLIGRIGYFNLFFSLSRTFFFLPFFYLGFSIKNISFTDVVFFCKKYRYIYLGCLLIALVIFFQLSYFELDKGMYWGALPFSRYNVPLLDGIIFRFLYIVIAMCSIGLVLTLPNNSYSILSMVGKKSLEIYLFHFIWIRIAFSLGFYELDISFYTKLVIYLFSTILVTYLCTLVFFSSFTLQISRIAELIYKKTTSVVDKMSDNLQH